jgi:hypothetical protein
MERKLPQHEQVVEGMADSNKVVQRSEIVRVVRNKKLIGLTVLKSAPHVVRF